MQCSSIFMLVNVGSKMERVVMNARPWPPEYCNQPQMPQHHAHTTSKEAAGSKVDLCDKVGKSKNKQATPSTLKPCVISILPLFFSLLGQCALDSHLLLHWSTTAVVHGRATGHHNSSIAQKHHLILGSTHQRPC